MKSLFSISLRAVCAGIFLAVFAVPVTSGLAQTIIDEWATVKAPPAPELKPVTIDSKSTALLLLDFAKQNCGVRPRCVASLPKVQKLLSEARAKNVLVVYSIYPRITKMDLLGEVAPAGNEPVVSAWGNKFYQTDLEKILKEKDIKTVIVTGTAAHGAVINTASVAAIMGLKVIVPVDGMSADPYAEQYTAWHLANGPGGVGPQVTLTKIDMIQF